MRGRGDFRGSTPGRGSSSTRGFGANTGGYSSGPERGRGSWPGRGGYRGPRRGRGGFTGPSGLGPNEFGPPPGGFPARGRGFRGGEHVGPGHDSGMPFRGGFSSRGRGQDYSAMNKRIYSEEPRVYLWKLTDDINEDHLMEYFGRYGEIKDVFIALSAGGSTRVGYALLYPATPEIVESIVNSSPHTVNDTALRASYPRDSAPIAKRWRAHDAEEPSHDGHVTQTEGDSFQDVGNVPDDYISEASLTIDYEDGAEHSQEEGADAMQTESEPKTTSAVQGETVLTTTSLPFDGKVVQPMDEQSKIESGPVEESEQRKRQSPTSDEGRKKHGEPARRQVKEGEEEKQGKDESSREHRSSSERGRTPRSDHRDRRDRLERRQRSRSRERRRRSPSPREERSRFGGRRGGRHSPPSSDRFTRSRRPLSSSGPRPRTTSRWDSDEKSESRFRQSFPPSQDNKYQRPGQDFNSQGRGRPRDYPRPGPQSMEAQPGPMGPRPGGPEPVGPMGPGHAGAHDPQFSSPPWGRKTLLPTPPVLPNEDTPLPPPGRGGPARDNYPPHDGPPPGESRWNRRESAGQGFADQHYGPPSDHQGRPFERDSFGGSPPFADNRGPPPPQSHHPQDTHWQRHGRDPMQGGQQPGFGGSGNQQQPQVPPGWQQDERPSGGMQPSNFGSDSQRHSNPRGHHEQGFVSDSRSQPGAPRPSSDPYYDGMQPKFVAPQQSYQGQPPPHGYTIQSGKGSTENYGGQQASYSGQQQNVTGQEAGYGGQQQNFDGQQINQGGQQQQNFGQQQTFGGQPHTFEKHPQNYSGQWATNEQGPRHDERKPAFDQQRGFDGQQQKYEGQQQRVDGQQQGFRGQQQRFDGQQQRNDGQQKFEGQQQRHDGQQQRYDGQQQRYDGQQQRYDGQQQQRYDGQQHGQQQRYDGQQHGQQQRYDGQYQQRYDGQQHGQQQRYDGQYQQRYDGQQQTFDGQHQRYDGPEQRSSGQQQTYGQSQQNDVKVQQHYSQQPNYGQPQQEYGRGRDAPPNSRPTHPHQHAQGGYVSDSRLGQGQQQPAGVGPSSQGPPSTAYNGEGWRRQQGQPPDLFPQSRTNQVDYGTRASQYSHSAPQQGYHTAPSQQGQGSHDAVSMHRGTHEIPSSAHGNSAYGGGYQGDNMAKYGQYQGSVGSAGDARGPGTSRFTEEERQQGGSAQYGRPQQRKGEWQSHDQRDHTHHGQPSRDWSSTPGNRPLERSQPTPEVGYMPKASPASTQQTVPKIDTKALEALLADSDNIYSAYIKRAKSQD